MVYVIFLNETLDSKLIVEKSPASYIFKNSSFNTVAAKPSAESCRKVSMYFQNQNTIISAIVYPLIIITQHVKKYW